MSVIFYFIILKGDLWDKENVDLLKEVRFIWSFLWQYKI